MVEWIAQYLVRWLDAWVGGWISFFSCLPALLHVCSHCPHGMQSRVALCTAYTALPAFRQPIGHRPILGD